MFAETSKLMSSSCIVGILICIYALHVEHSKESNKEYRAFCDVSEYMSCSNVLTSK
uniref:vitamin-K-epoxide reductase (warfarin-sensitive) n=1 Tax=Schistosoma mansoni TaxID=6183 RepID=A0A146MIX5_SCHMA